MNTHNIKQLIKERYDELSNTNKMVAKFVMDNYQQCMLFDSCELAGAAKVSNSTVIRFAKALGFSGFLEYKNKIKEEYTSSQKVYSYLEMMSPSNDSGYIYDYFSSISKDLEVFTKTFTFEILDNFCKTILNSDTVYLMGIGSDEVIVSFLRNYLNVMGIKCVPVYHEGLTLKERLFLVNENDTMLLTAFPTLTQDEEWAAKHVKSKGAKLLVITDSEITANMLQADFATIFSETTELFFNSYVFPILFCNALLLRLYETEKAKTTLAMKNYQDMLENA